MYQDRQHAGQVLAGLLVNRRLAPVSLWAVPRGGVLVAAPVAQALNTRLEVLVTRKIGHPANPEVAIGAVMVDGQAVLDERLIATYAIPSAYVAQAVAREYQEIQRRQLAYSGRVAVPEIGGKTALVIDDGIATGYTVRAAVKWLQTLAPARLIVAVPVAPPEVVADLAREVDEVICPLTPDPFVAVGLFYRRFPQNTDEEIIDVIRTVNGARP